MLQLLYLSLVNLKNREGTKINILNCCFQHYFNDILKVNTNYYLKILINCTLIKEYFFKTVTKNTINFAKNSYNFLFQIRIMWVCFEYFQLSGNEIRLY